MTTLAVLDQIDDFTARATASLARAAKHKPGSPKAVAALSMARTYATLAQAAATVQASRAAGHRGAA